MGEAREVMDRLTDAVMGGRADEVRNLYADNATVMTPDAGEVRGRDAISAYFNQFSQAFPDASWEPLSTLEVSNTAIDEGYFIGTTQGRSKRRRARRFRRPASKSASASATSQPSRTAS